MKRSFNFLFRKTCNLLHCRIKDEKAECKSQDLSNIFSGIQIVDNKVYVAETQRKEIRIYNISENNELKYQEMIPLAHHVNNLEFTAGNEMFYVVGTVKNSELGEFNEKIKTNPDAGLSSTVTAFNYTNGHWKKRELLSQNTMFMSSATMLNNTLIIGSPTHTYVLICPVIN